jgi:hypothetical protein
MQGRGPNHLVEIVLIVLAVGLLYARVTGAWYCSYDDFTERHRAMFEDNRSPARIFTTTHYVSYMYRPVTSGLQWLTWKYSHDDPVAFRMRNLLMHLVSVAMVYGIVWLIARSPLLAAGAALLFGVHPMANETVVVAIWTNATAYALFFSSFFFFLYSLRRMDEARDWRLPMSASLVCAFIALFTYEPTIVVFALMAGYLAVRRLRGLRRSRSYTVALVAGIAIETVFFLAVRHAMIAHAAPWNSLGIVMRNATMYLVALILPVDFVLSNAIFRTPLPSDLHFTPAMAIVPAAGAIALSLVAVTLARLPPIRERLANVDVPALLFFLGAIPLAFLPLLLFREHPSEHDLYPSVAFYTAIIAMLTWQLTRSRAAFAVIISLLALSFASGTWLRNINVERCGAIAQNIMTHLPVDDWRKGQTHVVLAPAPQGPVAKPYGMYNHTGLATIEVPGSGVDDAAQAAVQIATRNERVVVEVVNSAAMGTHCKTYDACFLISSSGDVSPVAARNERASR